MEINYWIYIIIIDEDKVFFQDSIKNKEKTYKDNI